MQKDYSPNFSKCKWYDVKDCYPPTDGEYLVCHKDKPYRQTEVFGFAAKGNDIDEYDLKDLKNVFYRFDSEWGYIPEDGVTHWSYMPTLPLEKDD